MGDSELVAALRQLAKDWREQAKRLKQDSSFMSDEYRADTLESAAAEILNLISGAHLPSGVTITHHATGQATPPPEED